MGQGRKASLKASWRQVPMDWVSGPEEAPRMLGPWDGCCFDCCIHGGRTVALRGRELASSVR